MQPLKTYEVTLRKTRVFTRKVKVKALCIEDAQTLASYVPGGLCSCFEGAEKVVAVKSVNIDLARTLEHYTAMKDELAAQSKGQE